MRIATENVYNSKFSIKNLIPSTAVCRDGGGVQNKYIKILIAFSYELERKKRSHNNHMRIDLYLQHNT